jgi:hypothetical protein
MQVVGVARRGGDLRAHGCVSPCSCHIWQILVSTWGLRVWGERVCTSIRKDNELMEQGWRGAKARRASMIGVLEEQDMSKGIRMQEEEEEEEEYRRRRRRASMIGFLEEQDMGKGIRIQEEEKEEEEEKEKEKENKEGRTPYCPTRELSSMHTILSRHVVRTNTKETQRST